MKVIGILKEVLEKNCFCSSEINYLLTRVPSPVLVYACCPGIIINSILYHSQNISLLDNKSPDHSADSSTGLTIKYGIYRFLFD